MFFYLRIKSQVRPTVLVLSPQTRSKTMSRPIRMENYLNGKLVRALGDGNCFFRSVLLSLALKGQFLLPEDAHLALRKAVVRHMDKTVFDEWRWQQSEDWTREQWIKEHEKNQVHVDLLAVEVCADLLQIQINVWMNGSIVALYNQGTKLGFATGASNVVDLKFENNHYDALILRDIDLAIRSKSDFEQITSRPITCAQFDMQLSAWLKMRSPVAQPVSQTVLSGAEKQRRLMKIHKDHIGQPEDQKRFGQSIDETALLQAKAVFVSEYECQIQSGHYPSQTYIHSLYTKYLADVKTAQPVKCVA